MPFVCCDRRRLGDIWLVENECEVTGHLGLDPLDAKFTESHLAEILKKHRAPVKAVLCKQKLIAGIGNIYADEALFRAGIHPLREGKSLSEEEVRRLFRSIQKIGGQASTPIDFPTDLRGRHNCSS